MGLGILNSDKSESGIICYDQQIRCGVDEFYWVDEYLFPNGESITVTSPFNEGDSTEFLDPEDILMLMVG